VRYYLLVTIHFNLNINRDMPVEVRKLVERVFIDYYVEPIRPETPKVQIEAALILKDNKPVQFGPRRLGFAEKKGTANFRRSVRTRYN